MKSVAMRELLLPFIRKYSQPETLAPYFCNALYQALYRSRLPAGLSPRIVEASLKRCVYLEGIIQKCGLPSPELWAKEPLHPRIVRMASQLKPEERAELGSLLLCYLHGSPMAAISLWWQEKADFEVCVVIERFMGGSSHGEAENTEKSSPSQLGFPGRARLESRVLMLASPGADSTPHGTAPSSGAGAPPPERVIRFSKGRFGKRNVELVEESESAQPQLSAV